MRGHWESFIPTTNHHFVSFWKKINHFQFIIKIFGLAIEIYKFLHNLWPCIMNNILKVNQSVPYDLRKGNLLQGRNPSSVRYGTEPISYTAPKLWTLVPKTIKNLSNKKWESGSLIAHGSLCKVYMQHVGFF